MFCRRGNSLQQSDVRGLSQNLRYWPHARTDCVDWYQATVLIARADLESPGPRAAGFSNLPSAPVTKNYDSCADFA